ncbi:hypothetical protein IJH46_00265, partial [Candidatus Saccharibacteria bacterium]|nr:hypothetical protein [Candidatus Saccharibacteria bacterium]
MRKICVYTCITGEYDKLNEIKKPEKGVDYVCFTNNVKLKSKTWKVIQIHELELSNRLLARKIKILGHPTINKKYEVFVWTDADVIWERAFEDFVEFLGEKDFAVFMHHSRIQIYEEAVACLENRKDTIQNIQK